MYQSIMAIPCNADGIVAAFDDKWWIPGIPHIRERLVFLLWTRVQGNLENLALEVVRFLAGK